MKSSSQGILLLGFALSVGVFAQTPVKRAVVIRPQAEVPAGAAPAETYTPPPPSQSAQQKAALKEIEDQRGQAVIQQLMQLGGAPVGNNPLAGAMGSGSGNSSGNSAVDMSNCDPCGSIPGTVFGALREAQSYRQSCSLANTGPAQNIAINDYSGDGTPTMYIFDSTGKCLRKTAVTYGNGAGTGRPVPCSSDGDHTTPPGFHLTAPHDGAKYDRSNSLLMVGTEGQGSAARNILIHPSNNPGQAASWGCSGVDPRCLQTVKGLLKTGGLVYNYFGDTPPLAKCNNTNGADHRHETCQLDPGGAGATSKFGNPSSTGRAQ